MNVVSLREATVGVVGLGLMGGSLGRALDGICRRRLGADRDAATARRAVELGAIDEAVAPQECAARADLLVLAMPVQQVVSDASVLASAARPGAVVTDLGSTKERICATFDTLPSYVAAIGGHPMCGREQSGIDAGDPSLYHGAQWALVPCQRTTPGARELLLAVVDAVGAKPTFMDAATHDVAVAAVSHAPYVVAQALVAARSRADQATAGAASALAASGFAGATRLAAGDVEMWADILTSNSAHLREAIRHLRDQLDLLAGLLDDPAEVRVLLAQGRKSRGAV